MSLKSSAVFVSVIVSLALWSYCDCESPIFHNQFAVHVPDGKDVADSIAGKHGFVNMGQVRYILYSLIFLYSEELVQ